LKDGAIHKLGDQPSAYQKIDFNNYDLRLNLKTGWKDKQTAEKNPADMSLGELAQAVQALRSKNADAKIQMVKIHEKFSVPLACLVLGIIGIPLGIQSRAGRTGKSMGFVWSIGVLLAYYLLTSAGTSLAERGVVLLEVGMWAANGISLCLGIYLLVKAANESPVLLLVWLERGIEILRQGWGRPQKSKEWKPKE
jgi:lipopolysaccharide export system permease protein